MSDIATIRIQNNWTDEEIVQGYGSNTCIIDGIRSLLRISWNNLDQEIRNIGTPLRYVAIHGMNPFTKTLLTIYYIMPYKFRFFIHDHLHFSGTLSCHRCQAISKNGHQCKRMSCIGEPKCWSHLLTDHHLQIKTSTIPHAGRGLFAMDKSKTVGVPIFKKDQRIIYYLGEVIDTDTLETRYTTYTAPYGIMVANDKYIDSALERGAGSLVNSPAKGVRPNARLSLSSSSAGQGIAIMANKNIYNGDEIFASYGNKYRLDEPTRYSTK